jgi:hypothetical protein
MSQSTLSNNNPAVPVDFNVQKWYSSNGGSIYLKYVPTHIVGKEELTYLFSEIGKVSRVDIVNSAPNKNTGASYRMAFIHFDFWYPTPHSEHIRNILATNFPHPIQYLVPEYSLRPKYASNSLTLMINTRPVPKTIYNVDQLSDMYHRLREEYNDTVTQLRQEIDELKSMVRQLVPTTSADEAAEDSSSSVELCESQMNFAKSREERDPLIYKELPQEE